ncbi:MAG: hypothetical protein LBV54_05080 [Puniceicoccales bacterium]|jgi:vacuolar-type H+-ATPase subunit I/STV1|nr:hypothetical protein [Puniceicoccales bacterium]
MDIRNPIGLLFTLLGLLLVGAGLFGGPDAVKAKNIQDAVNINLWWGVVTLVFGILMLGLALRARKKD